MLNFFYFYFIVSAVFVFIILFSISFLTLWERKLLGGIQRRHGPVFAGFFGLLQPFADGLKLLFKTFNVPSGVYYHVFVGASIYSLVLSLLPWTVIPFNFFFVLADINCSLLFVLLISSIGKYTILFSGWASNSKYGVLGSIRSGAQMASYEIPLLLSLLPIFFFSSTLNFTSFVIYQTKFFWFLIFIPNAVIFFICLLAETNRPPFDLPEAESELVAGYNIEYSSLSFAVFFLAEYNHIITSSFLFSILFLGGWDLPYFVDCFSKYAALKQTIILIIKSFVVLNLIIYVRGVLPRYRFTDLISMCWQSFVPLMTTMFLFVWSFNVVSFITLNYNLVYVILPWLFYLYISFEVLLFCEALDKSISEKYPYIWIEWDKDPDNWKNLSEEEFALKGKIPFFLMLFCYAVSLIVIFYDIAFDEWVANNWF